MQSNDGRGDGATGQAGLAPHPERYVFRLFVSGMTPRSVRALAVVKAICQEHLAGRYELEVIDIYQRPDLASEEDILAAPTLVKKLPPPQRRFVGDLADVERVLVGLGLRPGGAT